VNRRAAYEQRIQALTEARDWRRLRWAVGNWIAAELKEHPPDEIEQAVKQITDLAVDLNASNGGRKRR